MNQREAQRLALYHAASTIESSLNGREDLDEYTEVDESGYAKTGPDGHEVNKVTAAMMAIADRLYERSAALE